MLDAGSLYGNLLGAPGPQNKPQPETVVDEPGPTAETRKAGSGDDMFADLPKQAPTAGPAPAPAPVEEKKEEPASSQTQLPQTFTAAKLMMPPVRKKVEPTPGRKTMPVLDIAKLQEEKEALMRQRAAAAAQEDKPAANSSGASPSSGGSTPSFFRPSDNTSAEGGGTMSLYGSPDEEYDPAKPNDYDEFCRRRMRLKAEEELEKRRQEALARHQKAAAPEPKEDDFATRMMKKMGWTEGGGLGKDGQGMAAPLILKKTDQKQGVMVEGQKREAPSVQPQPQPEAKQAKVAERQRPPSRVVLLNNLVGAGEVDEDLEGETVEEAGKYGKVTKCVIKEIKGLPDDQAVRIFLEFEKIDEATKALVDMNGRFFGGRVVKARFFDPERFAANDLINKPDE